MAFALGCHLGGPARPREATDQYLIEASELERTNQGNVYDAIHQLRPAWLTRPVGNRTGDAAIAAYVDDHLLGPVSALQRVSIFGVQRVRYLAASEAQVRFGQSNSLRAAVLVETER